jgi:DNA-binding transcriptional LysR family regulator
MRSTDDPVPGLRPDDTDPWREAPDREGPTRAERAAERLAAAAEPQATAVDPQPPSGPRDGAAPSGSGARAPVPVPDGAGDALPPLSGLQAFVAVADSLADAAALGTTPDVDPAVGTTIETLERHWDLRLFSHDRWALRLTDEGRRLLPVARQALDEIARLDRLARATAAPAPRLRLGASTRALRVALPRLVTATRAALPDLELEQRSCASPAEAIAAVTRGRLDAVIVEDDEVPDGMPSITVAVVPFLAAVPDGSRLSLERTLTRPDLARHAGRIDPAVDARSAPTRLLRVATEGTVTIVSADDVLGLPTVGVALRPLSDLPPQRLVLAWSAIEDGPTLDGLVAAARSLGG